MRYSPRTTPPRLSPARLCLALVAAVTACWAAASCASTTHPFLAGPDAAPETSPTFTNQDGPDVAMTVGPCTNYQCQQVQCPSGGTTTVTGVVTTPALDSPDPLYNAVVYIPNGHVQAFTPGVACDRCGAPASGQPLTDALTAADGSFTLQNVPVGDDIPLVIQIGRWRRQVKIPHVEACVQNVLTPDLTHLPAKSAEGDIPLMAVATGALDPIECVLRKIGIADSEFTPPTGQGRVHLYVQNGLNLKPPTAPAASTLWTDETTLKKYDLVLFPCEGAANLKPFAAMQNVIDYATAGGRIFATHFSYVWIYDAPNPFPLTADWNPNQPPPSDPLTGLVDTSFPKGKAMADWLSAVGASPSYGEIAISAPRHDVDSVTQVSQGWISSFDPNTQQHFTFNTPVGADAGAQCGKVIFSDFHVAANEAVDAGTFPLACDDGPLTPQEKVIEFMLFDLASCIQNDRIPRPRLRFSDPVIRFIHTADWQLGLKLAFIPGDAGAIARNERFEAVRRIGALAKEREAQAIVVAGDVFDDNAVGQATLQRARDALGELAPTPVLLLPGNHDAGGPDSVLRRLNAGPHVRALLDTVPVDIGAARFYPCPLLRRHEREDPTRHLSPRAPSDPVRVAIAHGGLVDFGESESHNRIDWLAVLAKGFDYLALGDWHGTLRFGDSGRVYYAGTPEATRFKEKRPGNVLLVEVDGPGAEPRVEEIAIQRTEWIERSLVLNEDPDVDALGEWLTALPTKSRTLVDLTLAGALSAAARVRLDGLLERAKGELMLLRPHTTGLADLATDEDLERLSGDGIVGRAALALRHDDSQAARDALRLLYRFVLEDRATETRG